MKTRFNSFLTALVIMIMYEDNKRMRNEIDSLHKTLEALDIKRRKSKTAVKRKIEPFKL